MKWNIAICGLGAAARQIHLPAYQKLPAIKIVGGHDPTVKTSGLAFQLFNSPGEMIERTNPDIVTIATPVTSHFELTKIALQAGCHVFCEKPFMSSMEEAREIADLAAQTGKSVVVNNQYRFMNIHQAARKAINTPKFGELLFMSANQTFYVSDETEDGWRGGDFQRTCKEFGIHVLDLARYYFDEDPISINARMPKGNHPAGPDYLNLIQLEFSGDRVAHITLDRLSRGPHRYLDIRLDGSEGVIETRIGGHVGFQAGIKGGTRKPYVEMDVSMGGHARLYHGERFKKIASDPLDLFAHATSRLMAEFIHALETDSTPPCHASDNLRTLALTYAAYESSEKNQTVIMDYR